MASLPGKMEAKEALLNDEEAGPSSVHQPGRRQSFRPRLQIYHFSVAFILCNLVFFLFSLAVLGFSLYQIQSLTLNVDNRLLRQTSVYSPIFDKLPIPLKLTTMNGSFWPQNPPSIFHLPPSPEVDASWDRIADTHGFVLSKAEILKMGKDPTKLYRYPESYGYGPEAYMGILDVSHHLHCLNHLRRAAHGATTHKHAHSHSHSGQQVYFNPAILFPHEVYLDHCAYVLMEFITCHADVGVVTFNKVQGTPGPFADFNVLRKCRDFQALLDWKERNQVNVSEELWEEIFVTPEGIRELPAKGKSVL